MVYYAEDYLAARSYDDESLVTHGTLKLIQVDETSPNWVNSLVRRNIVSDETCVCNYLEKRATRLH